MTVLEKEIGAACTALKRASKAPGVDAVIALVNGEIAIIYQNGHATGKRVETLSLEIKAGEPYRCEVSTSGKMPMLPPRI